jgi:WD40 repeat protein
MVSHFESDIHHYSEKYHAGTRQWLLDDIALWKTKARSNKNQLNMCLVSGNPGMGKSVLAAKLCSIYKLDSTLAGCFFFQHHLGRRSNPKMLVQSLCYQFQSTIDGYSKLIEDDVAKIDPESLTTFELFSYLIKEPLSRLSSTSKSSMVVVIDALDECDYDSRADLLKLLIRDFVKLPQWIQIIMTTRPDKKILHSLKKIKSVIEISPEDSRNLSDIRLFLGDFLKDKMSNEEFHSGVELLVEKSEGMFLYFHYAIDALEDEESISLEELTNLLPDGIDDYYEHNFSRLFDALGEQQYRIFLQGILMARSDFPQDLVAPLLRIKSEEAIKIVSMVSTLLPVQNGSICIFHKSVRDWLLDKELAGKYAIDPLAGHKHLAMLCQKELKTLKRKFSSPSYNELSKSIVYRFIIQNIVYHICRGTAPSQVLSIIQDIQFMYFHLIYSSGTISSLLDDINDALALASKDSRKVHQPLLDCYNFIRRHTHMLDGNPNLIFQCALNEPRVLSERLGTSLFLADPRSAFPGLKVLLQVRNKSEQFIPPLTTFSSEDNVTSCTLSPDLSTLIISDFRGFVYFWDIRSGEVIHKIDMRDEFKFPYSIHTCSVSAGSKLIAYGNLNKALNFEGEKVPLLKAVARHEINSCIFSPSGDKIFTFAVYQDGLFELFKEVGVAVDIDFHLELWNVSDSTSHTLHTLKRKDRPMCACFSPDGKKVFCGYRNGIIIQWDAMSCVASACLLSPEVVIREGKWSYTSERARST